ncbi:M23 family metallopeptidase [Nafulsella turpanensis]|uniref:M23 family metallopeptidase n=1 Tax=Nafulsella turpanensis TaxID=1265690 RepID=UPI000349120F|nr:M23 family metallopeptidase [Nafulsella turpanensis]
MNAHFLNFRFAFFSTGMFLLLSLLSSLPSFAQESTTDKSVEDHLPIESVVIHPVYELPFKSNDHHYGQFKGALGDELGKDVMVVQYEGGPDKRFPLFYKNDGTSNEDWYGWNQKVLAPFSGKVIKVFVNEQVNQPGRKGNGRASSILFERSDGVKVVYGHVQDIKVKEGDWVEAGQHVAHVGNNGYAWMPHIHVGAWKGDKPLQIIFDLKALGKLRKR